MFWLFVSFIFCYMATLLYLFWNLSCIAVVVARILPTVAQMYGDDMNIDA